MMNEVETKTPESTFEQLRRLKLGTTIAESREGE